MDELEGALTAAQANTQVRLGDVSITTKGTWTGTGANALFFSYQDATGMTSEAFRSHFAEAHRSHQLAGIASDVATYTTAMGGVAKLDTVVPGNAEPFLTALISDPTPINDHRLFSGVLNTSVTINGNTKRFNRGFHVVVVGLRSGSSYAGAPVGILVVPTNGTGIYKFFKGTNETSWRRL